MQTDKPHISWQILEYLNFMNIYQNIWSRSLQGITPERKRIESITGRFQAGFVVFGFHRDS